MKNVLCVCVDRRERLADALRPALGEEVDAYQRAKTVDFHPNAWAAA